MRFDELTKLSRGAVWKSSADWMVMTRHLSKVDQKLDGRDQKFIQTRPKLVGHDQKFIQTRPEIGWSWPEIYPNETRNWLVMTRNLSKLDQKLDGHDQKPIQTRPELEKGIISAPVWTGSGLGRKPLKTGRKWNRTIMEVRQVMTGSWQGQSVIYMFISSKCVLCT